jgi:S-formylglutathione hydrolase FrmB
MSGALDIQALLRDPERRQELVDRVFGPAPAAEEDVFALLDSADATRLPRLHVSCGTEDHLVDHSRRFAEAAEAKGADVTVDLRPGEHEWGFWDTEIQTVLDWVRRGPTT